MKIGILGGTGLLGTEIKKYFRNNFNLVERNYQAGIILGNKNLMIMFPYHSECNVNSEEDLLNSLFKFNLDIVIHAASYTQERFKKYGPDETYHVNCESPQVVCGQARDTKIIYISTDYVFDGTRGNYNELDVPNPLGFYAKTKWYAEGVFLSHGHRVIRTSFCGPIWPYDKAFEDKYSSRDTVEKIAPLIVRCSLSYELWKEILHVGTERKSFYELAKRIKPDVRPNTIPVPSDVPPDTSFDLTKMKGILGNDYKL
jgi:dTDP-4-dehydrorhamnose reductase